MAAKNDYILTDLQIITSITRARDIKRAELKARQAEFAVQIQPLVDEVDGLTTNGATTTAKPASERAAKAPAPKAPPATPPAGGQEAQILAVIAGAPAPISTAEIAEALDVEARTIRRAIGALRTSRRIVSEGTGRAVRFTAS